MVQAIGGTYAPQMITCNKERMKKEKISKLPENVEKAIRNEYATRLKEPHEGWFDYRFTTANIYGMDFEREWKKMRKLA